VPPSDESLDAHGLESGRYLTLIARPIPENSIVEIVRGFSADERGVKLAVLGKYEPDKDPYHKAVMDAASAEVTFLGPIYGDAIVPIRYHGLGYVHGHTVGGTNPSLVEALAARNPVIAHNNPYNRWVAKDAALYFTDSAEFSAALSKFLGSSESRAAMSAAALKRFNEEFTWDHIAGQYEDLILRTMKR
jgi:glycosyltransferase involved in cell wall biosynthesis